MPQPPITEAREAHELANLKRAERAAGGMEGRPCCLEEERKLLTVQEVTDADRLGGEAGGRVPRLQPVLGALELEHFQKKNRGEGLSCLSSD